nr:MAG TPA: hypothetical protein [Caudoviricetes sp.]
MIFLLIIRRKKGGFIMAGNPYQYNPYLNGSNNIAGMGNMAF